MGVCLCVEGEQDNPFCCRWSYSGFMEFRKQIARSIAIDLEEMQGFRKKHPTDEGFVKYGTKSWDTVENPVKLFLNHSDCGGNFSCSECALIYPALLSIVNSWEKSVMETDVCQGRTLCMLMQYCSENNQSLCMC